MIDMVELDQMLKSSSSLLLERLDLMDINRLETDDGDRFVSQETGNTERNRD